MKFSFFTTEKICILHGQVFIMTYIFPNQITYLNMLLSEQITAKKRNMAHVSIFFFFIKFRWFGKVIFALMYNVEAAVGNSN